jgi:4-amino-4-deoxy-L-arabinose transferase-like glycosyltransferase
VSARRGIALAWAAAVLVAAGATSRPVGISRDEGVYLEAARTYAAFWPAALRDPPRVLQAADRHYAWNHEHPGLGKGIFAITRTVLHDLLGWTGEVAGARAGAWLLAAFLALVLSSWGTELAGPVAGALAPALFFLVPRYAWHAHPAALDLPVTAFLLAATYAFWRSTSASRGRLSTAGWAIATGLLFGCALGTKHNAWFLPVVLLAAWAIGSVRFRQPLPAPGSEGAVGSWRGHRYPWALVAMAILGPAVLLASWPWLWHRTLPRLGEWVGFHLHHENYPWAYMGTLLRDPPFPVTYPLVVTALTVPFAIGVAMAGGLAQACGRIVAAWRGRAPEVSLPTEWLLVLSAVFPIALVSLPTVPHFGGVKHWMPAMPFLALLGARALVSAGRLLWPARAGAVTGVLAAFALLPAAWQVVHFHPFGTAAWNELAGGAPGAATMGMQRQFWGESAAAVLPALNAHAAPGARVWFQETTDLAARAYQRDGLLRPDLAIATGPEDADISVWQHHLEFRDREFRTWTAFGNARPVAGAYLDEVPLAQVYARPGAWR